MKQSERRHLERVKSLPCSVCGQPPPSQAHHIRTGAGMGQRPGKDYKHYLTVALCWDCHQGPSGIHGDRTMWRLAKMEELDALAVTIEGIANATSHDHQP